MQTSKSYKLQMHKHNDCMRTHTRTLTPTNPNAHSFTTTQTQDQLNILRRIWTTEHAFGKISLSESRKASPVKELSQNKKRKLGGGGLFQVSYGERGNEPDIHVFGLWEDAGGRGKNRCRHKLHTKETLPYQILNKYIHILYEAVNVHFCWKRVLWGMNHFALSGPVFQPWRLLLDPKRIIFLSSSLQPSAQLKITVTLHIEYFKSFGLFFIMLIGDMWNQFSFNELWCSSIFLKKQSNLSLSFRERSYVTHWGWKFTLSKSATKLLVVFPFFPL